MKRTRTVADGELLSTETFRHFRPFYAGVDNMYFMAYIACGGGHIMMECLLEERYGAAGS